MRKFSIHVDLLECHYLTFGDNRTVNTWAGRKKTIIQQVTTATRQCFIQAAGTEVDDDDSDDDDKKIIIMYREKEEEHTGTGRKKR